MDGNDPIRALSLTISTRDSASVREKTIKHIRQPFFHKRQRSCSCVRCVWTGPLRWRLKFSLRVLMFSMVLPIPAGHPIRYGSAPINAQNTIRAPTGSPLIIALTQQKHHYYRFQLSTFPLLPHFVPQPSAATLTPFGTIPLSQPGEAPLYPWGQTRPSPQNSEVILFTYHPHIRLVI